MPFLLCFKNRSGLEIKCQQKHHSGEGLQRNNTLPVQLSREASHARCQSLLEDGGDQCVRQNGQRQGGFRFSSKPDLRASRIYRKNKADRE